MRRLVLYEPGLGTPYPAGTVDAVEKQVAAGDGEAAVLALLVGIMEMTAEEVESMRSSAWWPARLATIATLSRELRTEDSWVYRPGRFDGTTAPTHVLAGSDGPAVQTEATRRAVAAIAGSRVRVLEGHGHFAHRTDPAMVAAIVREYTAP